MWSVYENPSFSVTQHVIETVYCELSALRSSASWFLLDPSNAGRVSYNQHVTL